MLDFNEKTKNAEILAIHYAKRLDNQLLIDFMSSSKEISSDQEAKSVIDGFWKMTDFAIEDNNSDVVIEGISGIEFWMHKLFNKVYGYMVKHGFEALWNQALDHR